MSVTAPSSIEVVGLVCGIFPLNFYTNWLYVHMRFDCAGSHKMLYIYMLMALAQCPCAFRLPALCALTCVLLCALICALPCALKCHMSYVCSCVLSHVCSYVLSCACSCVLSHVCSSVLSCVCSCVLSYVCSSALTCVPLCAPMCSYVLSYVCSHDTVSFSPFHPPHCLGCLAGIICSYLHGGVDKFLLSHNS